MGKASRRRKPKSKQKRPLFKKLRIKIYLIILVIGIICGNFLLQISQKPTEVLSLLFGQQVKTPYQTWKKYGPYFKEHATNVTTASYLAALAQTESAGDPFASPQWRLNFNRAWTHLFAPESTSVGLFQFTAGTFRLASDFCIHDHKSTYKSKWYNLKGCWFNSLYMRFSPSDSTEMASSFLTHQVNELSGKRNVSQRKKQRLASIIHLCGKGKGKKFVRSGFELSSLRRCGSHSVKQYVRKVERLQNRFKKIIKTRS